MKIEAASAVELLEALRATDIIVPARTEGRTTEHTELYTICHLLSTLAKSDLLHYPITLVHSDRPDFVLTQAGTTIGIEHTEAVPQNEAAKQALREQGIGQEVHFITPVHPGEERRSSKDLKAEIKADEMGDGWAGDQAEREWAEAILYFLTQKESKLAAEGFNRHDEDWLLIYESWPLPMVDLKRAAEYFCTAKQERTSGEQFHRVFVMSNGMICKFTGGAYNLLHDHDLWQ